VGEGPPLGSAPLGVEGGPAGCLDLPPVAASTGPVGGPESFEDDAFDVVFMAGGQESLGVGPGEAGHDSARSGQVQLLEDSPALGIRPVH
jgi:hypothetical protein